MAAPDYSGMTPEQRAEQRRQLSEAAIALRKLQGEEGLPAAGYWGGLGPAAPAIPSGMEEVRRQTEQRAAELEAQIAAIDQAEEAEKQRRHQEAVRARIAAATQGPPSVPAASPVEGGGALSPTGGPATPWAGIPYRADVTPQGAQQALAAAPVEYKNVIVSRRGGPGEGAIVFETVRVPVDQAAAPQGEGDYQGPGLGVEEWKERALAENAARRLNTERAGALNPSGQVSQGFLVSENRGAYSPSRQVDLNKSWEEMVATESPLMQDLWLEAKQKVAPIEAQAAAMQESETKRKLLTAQTGLAEENLRRARDPMIEVRERMLMHEELMRRIQPEVASRVEVAVRTTVEALKAAGQEPGPDLIDLIRRKALEKETGQSYSTLLQQIMGTDPRVAVAQQRALSYGQ